MWRSLRPAIIAVVSVTAGRGILACGGATGTRNPAALQARSAVTSTVAGNLVVQLTGLLLVVPPAAGSTDVQVLIPEEANHVAWIGFGMGSDSTGYARTLCDDTRPDALAARTEGICYVDLEKWQVGALGTGGTVVQNVASQLPTELVSVTSLSGGQHRANPSSSHVRSRIVLSAGAPDESCMLATWDLERYVGNGVPPEPLRQQLINRLSWKISGGFSRVLVFTSGTATHRVNLPGPDADGNIFIVLVHVPQHDLAHLPPARPTTLQADRDASHFAAFYNLLVEPGTSNEVPHDPARRPIPRFHSGHSQPCDVFISKHAVQPMWGDSAVSPLDRVPPPPLPAQSSLTTFGCVLAGAEGE